MYDVTIGMPVYESADYIERALLSALGQSYRSIEFLIVDDCGSDHTMDIVNKIKRTHHRGADIRILRNEGNQGVAASRNRIIDEARGQYLYFMDSDDALGSDAIARLMTAVVAAKADIAFGSYEKIALDGEHETFSYPDCVFNDGLAFQSYAYSKVGAIQASACNYVVKTSVLRTNHLRFIIVDYWEDLAFTFNLVAYVEAAVLMSEVTYYYYCRENSLSHYQQRREIPKSEFIQSAAAVDYLKNSSRPLHSEKYFPDRCLVLMKLSYYVACHALRRRKAIIPPIAGGELRSMLRHPATLSQICRFSRRRLSNLAWLCMGRLPSGCCVAALWVIDKALGKLSNR